VPRGPLSDATVVFDLDGTLVDTAPDLTNALNDVLTRRGHAAVPAEIVRSAVSLGARAMIEEGLRQLDATDDIDGMLAIAASRNEKCMLLILDEIEDPQNLGALVRTADCAAIATGSTASRKMMAMRIA
jgi:phosphoglycolate phosphatase